MSVFHRYLSHSLQALQFTGPMTIHFRVIATHDSRVLEAVTTEGRHIWVILHSWYDAVVSLRVGDDLCLFQGFCCGSVTGVPVFHVPPPSWNSILVKRSTGETPPRVLEMFAGIGGQQSCFGQLEKANTKAISELRTEYVTGYNELKEILSNSPKSRRVAEAVP